MKRIFILSFLLVAVLESSYGQNSAKGFTPKNNETDSLYHEQLKKEVDSLRLIESGLVELSKSKMDIIKSQEIIDKKKIELNKVQIKYNNLKLTIPNIDTVSIKHQLKALNHDEDSIRLMVVLIKHRFHEKIKGSNATDAFCKSTQKFFYDFLPDLDLYFYKTGKDLDLDRNKNKIKELMSSSFVNVSPDMYAYIIEDTFLAAKNNEEFKKYIDLFYTVDISKCD